MTRAGGAVARGGLLMSACAVSQLGLIREKAMVKRGRRGEGESHHLPYSKSWRIRDMHVPCLFHSAHFESHLKKQIKMFLSAVLQAYSSAEV